MKTLIDHWAEHHDKCTGDLHRDLSECGLSLEEMRDTWRAAAEIMLESNPDIDLSGALELMFIDGLFAGIAFQRGRVG